MTSQDVHVAFVEAQLRALAPEPAPLLDDPRAVAGETATLIAGMPPLISVAFHETLDLVSTAAFLHHGRAFEALSVADRTAVIERLERTEPWSQALTIVESLGSLVIHSRPAARALLRFRAPEAEPIDSPEPARPDLDAEHDVCVIGSGAGGAVAAWRLAAEGKRVLVLEAGAWRNPRDLSARDDRALLDLYKHAGAQPGWPTLDRIFRPSGLAMVNVLQAQVVGGGPTVNNAIHLPMTEETWRRWRDDEGFPVEWDALHRAQLRVHEELGVNVDEVVTASGARARGIQEAAMALRHVVQELPVTVRDCIGCGGCNVGCRYGRKTAGLHGPRPAGAPASYLERALAAGAAVAPHVEAHAFRRTGDGRARSLSVRDRGVEREVRARSYVLAAGPVASSRILQHSGLVGSPVGRRMSANVVTPVTALFPEPIAADPARPDPGLQMCYFVGRRGKLLETFFHYPGSLAVAMPKGLREHARVMRGYDRMAVCGVVVPTVNEGAAEPLDTIKLSLTSGEFGRMVQGIEQIAELFFEAGASEVIPATRHAVSIRRASATSDVNDLRRALRGPADLALATPHPQGGNAMRRGADGVVDESFRVRGLANVSVADASLFPAGCDVNPQNTVMALAHLAAERALTP